MTKTRTEHPVDSFMGFEDVHTIAEFEAWAAAVVAAVPDAYRDNTQVFIILGDYSSFSVFRFNPLEAGSPLASRLWLYCFWVGSFRCGFRSDRVSLS